MAGAFPCCCKKKGSSTSSHSCAFFGPAFGAGDWNQLVGSWTIGSTSLSIASSGATAECNTSHPDGSPNTAVVVSVSCSAANDIVRILLAYVDSSNYLFAEWKCGNNGTGSGGYLKTYKRVSGTDTLLNTTLADFSAGVTYTWNACVSNGNLFSSQIGNIISSGGGVSVSVASPFFALGTGGTVTGTVTFSSVTATRVESGCSKCMQCGSACITGTAPSAIRVLIGASSVLSLCSGVRCWSTATEYIVNPSQEAVGGQCLYKLYGISFGGCSGVLSVKLYNSSGIRAVNVIFEQLPYLGSPPVGWSKILSYTAAVDCMIDIDLDPGLFGTSSCTPQPTCHVTGIA